MIKTFDSIGQDQCEQCLIIDECYINAAGEKVCCDCLYEDETERFLKNDYRDHFPPQT